MVNQQRFDVVTVREYEKNGEKKSAWTRIGVMVAAKTPGAFVIMLDALPLGNRLYVRAAEDKAQRGPRVERDEIPF